MRDAGIGGGGRRARAGKGMQSRTARGDGPRSRGRAGRRGAGGQRLARRRCGNGGIKVGHGMHSRAGQSPRRGWRHITAHDAVSKTCSAEAIVGCDAGPAASRCTERASRPYRRRPVARCAAASMVCDLLSPQRSLPQTESPRSHDIRHRHHRPRSRRAGSRGRSRIGRHPGARHGGDWQPGAGSDPQRTGIW